MYIVFPPAYLEYIVFPPLGLSSGFWIKLYVPSSIGSSVLSARVISVHGQL